MSGKSWGMVKRRTLSIPCRRTGQLAQDDLRLFSSTNQILIHSPNSEDIRRLDFILHVFREREVPEGELSWVV